MKSNFPMYHLDGIQSRSHGNVIYIFSNVNFKYLMNYGPFVNATLLVNIKYKRTSFIYVSNLKTFHIGKLNYLNYQI